MAMRSAAVRIPFSSLSSCRVAAMEGLARSSAPLRYFNGTKDGRVLSEEERAKENVYIQKMEKERLEKLKKKLAKEQAETEKNKSEMNPGASAPS